MAYVIDFKPSARKAMSNLDRTVAVRILGAIEALADNPRPPGCKKLADEDNLWRIRIGDWRVVYQIQDDKLLVLVVRVAHRSDVYR
jgi:mRNA interferase RelE/StbE